MEAINVQGLKKRFGPKPALKNVSLKVPVGSVFGFLGPNGAGKTTTIRCLMDYIRPDSGSVSILGQDASRQSVQLKREIGYLSSDMQLNQEWTAGEHIRLFEDIKGRTQLANRLIKRLDLDLKPKVKQLSSGNKQKLGIVLAFIGEPKLLIMDEPTRALDPLLQKELYGILAEYRGEGRTVFLSSHNLGEVQKICDEVALIKDGTVIETKTMSDIRDMKIHIVTATSKRPLPEAELVRVGAEQIELRGDEVSFRIHGDINPLMRHLATYNLTDISITHADLEDIFLEQYK